MRGKILALALIATSANASEYQSPYCGGPNGIREDCWLGVNEDPKPRLTKTGPNCPAQYVPRLVFDKKKKLVKAWCEEWT